MRTGMSALAACLLLAFGAGPAGAYEQGPDVIRECPSCKTQLVQQTTLSGSTLGARLWSDGKLDAPMMPDRPALVKCPACQSLLWIDELYPLGQQYPNDTEKEWPSALMPERPAETDLLSVTTNAALGRKKEIYARSRAWWFTNDAARTNESASVAFTPAQEKNLKALADLLDEKDQEERLLKAEALRELGRFGDCLKLLGDDFTAARDSASARAIKELAEQKKRTVREVPR